MNFYFLCLVFLYVGGCNARVVPLDFKLDKSKNVDSSITENEFIHESPMDEGILGHNLPDIVQSEDLDILNPEEDNATIPESSNRNESIQSADSTPKEMAVDEESNLGKGESTATSDLLLEELNSTSEFRSKNNSDSIDSFETNQVNGTLDDKRTEDLTFKNETASAKDPSLDDLDQGNNMDLVKIEKILSDTLDQNETFEFFNSEQNETFEVNSEQNETFEVNSEHNETFEVNNENKETFEIVNSTGSIDNFLDLQPLSNDTNVEEDLLNSAENITEEFTSNNLTSESLDLTNDSASTAGGIFSGFEFLINSEVARNAAKAMEVFNFTDPLTDHIMEENEFHSFLPAFNPIQDLDTTNQTGVNSIEIFTNSSEESDEIRPDLNASSPSGNETSIVFSEAEPEETKEVSSMPLNLNETREEGNKTELLDLVEKSDGNISSEVSSPLENSEEKIELASEASISKENVNASVSNSSAVEVPKCPPPGWCIFWFLSQDACAVNEHCLGNRICCKIGCSKTCVWK